ncbi:Transglycosylase SLT domain-containing protein [Amphibacillus marinus]|uniref:Transglycosylase SLT domain-containing protein n=1 Tax=Amphibacillus marinus TaxID=872970 RepID=A0A1H8HGR2_9BACI|nr:transglycosylase SLT domain-containing protein [Amphibacillus marinus]SEN55481.1 Transglycosylase SLT domain-containing protein [Amphibacillus marinus]
MKKGIAFILTVLLTSAIILFFYTKHLDSRLNELEHENTLLNAQNRQLQAESTYQIEKVDVKLTGDYNYWASIEELAKTMVDDSEGRFKKTWAIYLANEATQYDLDPFIVYELLKVETGHTFDPELVGPDTIYGNAYGMSQFMKNTAPWIAEMAGLPYEDDLLFDPYYSMQLAIVYLDFLYHKYDNWDEALTAYNRGMTGMENYKAANGSARSQYADQILRRAERYDSIAMVN